MGGRFRRNRIGSLPRHGQTSNRQNNGTSANTANNVGLYRNTTDGGSGRHNSRRRENPSNRGRNNGPSEFHRGNIENIERNQSNNIPNNRNKYPFHIGFKYLETLLDKPVEEVMAKMLENKSFYDVLEKDMSPDLIVLITKLICKFCECDFSSLRIRILQKTLCPAFLNHLQIYISSLPFQRRDQIIKNSYFWKDPDLFWSNFIKICETAVKEMPQYFCENLLTILKVTNGIIPQFESNFSMHVSDGTKEQLKSLIQTTEAILLEFEKKERKVLSRNTDEGEPPNDFREISVYPTSNELINNQRPFLRKNVVQGPYRDIEHYLDVQYRLLREDFVGPLRDAIKSYKSDTKTSVQNVKIHKRVQFLNPVTATEHFCVLLKFDFGKKRSSFSYENSRRFMFGSLVCFTCDNFRSLIFGRIVDRDEKYLKNAEVVIGFDTNEQVLYNKDYIMVECSIYFEPYYHVLSVMKTLAEDDFPMKNYIIEVDTNPALPHYITPQTVYKIKNNNNVTVEWPPSIIEVNINFFNFNPSQNEAFIAALTRQFAIIQGPPGTGKTFVGLKIAKTLLQNASSWYKRTPMLVICYTNHALDQFLEGLVGTTERIVRIGGQSKNENLKQFNLRAHSSKMSHATFEARQRVQDLMTDIKYMAESLSMIRKYDSIMDIRMFDRIIPDYERSWLYNATRDDLLCWLLDTQQPYERDQLGALVERTKLLEIHEDDNDEDGYQEEEDNNAYEDEDLLDLRVGIRVRNSDPLMKLPEIHQAIRWNRDRMTILEHQLNNNNYEVYFEYIDLQRRTQQMQNDFNYVQAKLQRAANGQFDRPKDLNAKNSQYIPRAERWALYFYWLNQYQEFLLKNTGKVNARFRMAYKLYSESKDLENIAILRNMAVIGMTTTGAARLHSSLQMIKSPIVIVEEAAEVLEAHIITSLTKDCQQLILIGDHQQLKPSTSNYHVEKFYHLGISLFERMILNNVQCFTLNVQHRMRPEISSLIKPAIYPNLVDHESVLGRPEILGMDKSLYFISHDNPEQSDAVGGTTKKNLYEVQYLICLAKYLVLNGYKQDQITILAAYLGQMFELQKQRAKEGMYLKEVRIAVLDNYQGEECDIILLSLVRNNADKKIGFLSIENRVCVALSRARIGLYIMGNMDMLCDNSKLWCQIKETLTNQDALGSALTLKCQNHDKITKISKVEDFQTVVEGGCDQICNSLLVCGHNCQRLCHILDRAHELNKCQEKCVKLLCDSDPLHVCKKKCYEECGPCDYKVTRELNCGHQATMDCFIDLNEYECLIQVPVTLPCTHETERPCYITPELFKCPFKCETRLDCGHSCILTCHIKKDPDHLEYKCLKECGKPRIGCTNQELDNHKCHKLCYEDCVQCEISMQKERTVCPHRYTVPCYKNVDEIECHKPCPKILPCGHKCKNECGEPCSDCKILVTKVIPDCNHKCKIMCCEEPHKKHCGGKCPRIMSCGHVCKKKCNEDCSPLKCKEMVDVALPAKCGHIIRQVPCRIRALYNTDINSVIHLESYCSEPCKELLNCGPENIHRCSGSCGECYQGRIHKRCADKCGRPLVCNHACEISCRETCKPCRKPCSYRCKHSACKKTCGQPCAKCKEKCNRQCKHQRCTRHCGEICNVSPCSMPCEKVLTCNHPCVGFCGDPCPPFCRICDKDELEELFFGTEDEEDARFVLLKDCKHVVESSGMEEWLKQDENQIKFKVCPKCKTTLCNTERYVDYVKMARSDIEKVKEKEFGNVEQINKKRTEVHGKVAELEISLEEVSILESNSIISFEPVNRLLSRLAAVNKKGHSPNLNLVELEAHEIKHQLMKKALDVWNQNFTIAMKEKYSQKIKFQLLFISKNIFRELDDITSNEINDIQKEIARFNRMIQFGSIMSSQQTTYNESKPEVLEMEKFISDLIFSLFKYDQKTDERVRERLVDLKKILGSTIGITETEKREIVKAMGLARGHWFKCPNGHPYAIADCGGAMVESNCGECRARIGGGSHRLRSDNSLAPEMDGAQHAAWSDAQNMANYRF